MSRITLSLTPSVEQLLALRAAAYTAAELPPFRPRNPRLVAAQALRREGYSLGVIARALGVSKTHVARSCAASNGGA